MRIAYVALKGMPFGGGIEKFTEEVGSRLSAKGHEITVYAMRQNGTRHFRYRGMVIKTVPTIRVKGLEKIGAWLWATLDLFLRKDVDIVHFHAFGSAMFSSILKIKGKKVVCQGHGLEWKRSRWHAGGRLLLKLIEIPSVKIPHYLTVVSQVQRAYLKNRYARDSVYIPPGVNPPEPEPPNIINQLGLKGNDYILFAGRLVREKGVHYLIEAYNRINTQMKLVIAGDEKYEIAYKSDLHQLALNNDKIIFTGFIFGKLLHELFSNCYLFVLPSELEGLPTVLLEAMSYENCCLVSDIPENLEGLNYHGYSFKSGNTNDLADKLNYLINNHKAVERVKRPARNHVEMNFSWNNVAADLENFYLMVMNQ